MGIAYPFHPQIALFKSRKLCIDCARDEIEKNGGFGVSIRKDQFGKRSFVPYLNGTEIRTYFGFKHHGISDQRISELIGDKLLLSRLKNYEKNNKKRCQNHIGNQTGAD